MDHIELMLFKYKRYTSNAGRYFGSRQAARAGAPRRALWNPEGSRPQGGVPEAAEGRRLQAGQSALQRSLPQLQAEHDWRRQGRVPAPQACGRSGWDQGEGSRVRSAGVRGHRQGRDRGVHHVGRAGHQARLRPPQGHVQLGPGRQLHSVRVLHQEDDPAEWAGQAEIPRQQVEHQQHDQVLSAD